MAAGSRRPCRLCGSSLDLTAQLDLGDLPACNAYSARAEAPATHPLSVTACAACGFVQLLEHPPVSFVTPRVPFVNYNEPDAHLDQMVERLRPMLAAGDAKTVLGVGPFDAPLLTRLAAFGLRSEQVDLLEGVPHETGTYPYLESLQAELRVPRLQSLGARSGTADLVVCRYLLEHSHEPLASLCGLQHLLNPGGHLLIEVPGSAKFLARRDYSFLWEEHISYFTPETLRAMAQKAGYEVLWVDRVEQPLEDLLIALLRPAKVPSAQAPENVGDALASFARFRDEFPKTRNAWKAAVDRVTATGGTIALFGAGHQALMFVNALRLHTKIAIVADDDRDKIGWFAPGLGTPIVPSSALLADPILAVCLLSTNPRIEQRIRDRLDPFLQRGGRLYSIYSAPEMQPFLGSNG